MSMSVWSKLLFVLTSDPEIGFTSDFKTFDPLGFVFRTEYQLSFT